LVEFKVLPLQGRIGRTRLRGLAQEMGKLNHIASQLVSPVSPFNFGLYFKRLVMNEKEVSKLMYLGKIAIRQSVE
jgi:hypothetical protein